LQFNLIAKLKEEMQNYNTFVMEFFEAKADSVSVFEQFVIEFFLLDQLIDQISANDAFSSEICENL
jgi:hypothetical protein